MSATITFSQLATGDMMPRIISSVADVRRAASAMGRPPSQLASGRRCQQPARLSA